MPAPGASGRTEPYGGDVTISVDSRFRRPVRMFTSRLPWVLVHELDHSERIKAGPGYGDTLLQMFVTEGMAVAFSHQVYPTHPPHRNVTRAQEHRLWQLAKPHLNVVMGDRGYRRWLGAGRMHGAGYTIGYDLVTSYLRNHPGTKPSDLVLMDANQILNDSHFSP